MLDQPELQPATPRTSPYIHVSWLARVMDGDPCHWQRWFLAHNKLESRAKEFDASEWTVRHTRLLTDLDNELRSAGLDPEIEYELSVPIGTTGAQLSGRIDCLTVDENRGLTTVYECKTGTPKNRDRIQTMLYMYFLTRRPRFRGLGMLGVLVYPDQREEVRGFPADFPENAEFFLGLLAGDPSPRRSPGIDCRDCPITLVDCPDRIDETAASKETFSALGQSSP